MPREIFEDLMEEEREVLKKLKPMLKSLVKGNGVRFSDSEFTTFDSTLSTYEEYVLLSDMEKILLHEYYLEKLRQKEVETKREKQRLIDEV